METQRWTLDVQEDPETKELFFTVPTEVLEMQGWKVGDTLKGTDNGDGSWSLSKSSNTQSE